MQNIIKKSQFVSPIITLPDPNEQKYAAWQTLRDSGMTIRQVAKMFNVSAGTIRNHTETRYDWRATNTSSHERCEVRKAYYVPIMLELRKLGYSNVDIGKKTGFSWMTVVRYIGNQPDETTLASYRVAGVKRRLRNLAVKNQLARDNGEPIPAVAEIIKPEVA